LIIFYEKLNFQLMALKRRRDVHSSYDDSIESSEKDENNSRCVDTLEWLETKPNGIILDAKMVRTGRAVHAVFPNAFMHSPNYKLADYEAIVRYGKCKTAHMYLEEYMTQMTLAEWSKINFGYLDFMGYVETHLGDISTFLTMAPGPRLVLCVTLNIKARKRGKCVIYTCEENKKILADTIKWHGYKILTLTNYEYKSRFTPMGYYLYTLQKLT
jgi:hypothetical protein